MRIILKLLVLNILSLCVQAQTVITYAGKPQTPGSAKTAVYRTDAKLYQPYGIAYDSKGNLYIAESGNHVISIIYADDEKLQIRVGGAGQASFRDGTGIVSRFNAPRGLVVGPNDEVYVADYDNHVIRKIDPFTSAGNPQNVVVFAGKHGVSGDYYTAQPGYADGPATKAQFNGPSDLAIDNNGYIYVADRNNHCIRQIDPQGNVTTIAGVPGSPGYSDGNALTAQFNTPTGLFVDGNDIYVADKLNSRIRKISHGTVSTVVEGLWTPVDLTIVNGIFYIIDQHRILTYDGQNLSTYAGPENLNVYGFQDGLAEVALFYNPSNIIALSNGELMISDKDNHIIRMIKECKGFKPTITQSGNTLTATEGIAYQWYINDSKIPGANSRTYTIHQSAYYSVEVTNQDQCIGKSDPYYATLSSVLESGDGIKIMVYPIPASSYLNVVLDNLSGNFNYRICNALGKEFMSGQLKTGINQLPVTGLNPGLYILEVNSPQYRTIRSFLVSGKF